MMKDHSIYFETIHRSSLKVILQGTIVLKIIIFQFTGLNSLTFHDLIFLNLS